jgi:hypothetical protein
MHFQEEDEVRFKEMGQISEEIEEVEELHLCRLGAVIKSDNRFEEIQGLMVRNQWKIFLHKNLRCSSLELLNKK